MIGRREFLSLSIGATAAGILAPEHLLKGRSMVSLCATQFWDLEFTQQLLQLQILINEINRNHVAATQFGVAIAETFRLPPEMMK